MRIRMPLRFRTAIALALMLLFTVGCGQKGDLFLPDDNVARYADQ